MNGACGMPERVVLSCAAADVDDEAEASADMLRR
jgi:hypothetical protein